MCIVNTSRGPVNVDTFCRTSPHHDQGEVVGIDFYTMDGGRVSLPLEEGKRLSYWLAERAVFDSTAVKAEK